MKAIKLIAVTLIGAMILNPLSTSAKETEQLTQARYDEYCHVETIKHLNDLQVKEWQAEYKAELEAQKQAEIEAKEKAEAEQKSTPKGLAQWENEHYADVHERANNSSFGDVNWTDEQLYEYLSNLNTDLLSSGEMQWMDAYTNGYLYDEPEEEYSEPIEEEYNEPMTEEDIQQEYEENWEDVHGELDDEWFECPLCGGHEATCGCFEY